MIINTVLAVETSCDDTSVAIVKSDGYVVACLSAAQDLAHKPFGGIVPEIASRNHTLQLLPLIEELFAKTGWDWSKIDGLAVTSRPGLIGSLLVGVVSVKTLALTLNKPFIGINHLEAHLLAPFLKDDKYAPPQDFAYPYLALAVSGGHTQIYLVEDLGSYKVLGRTLDDAAGEAFDKFAKLVGLGFPGGPAVDRMAKTGNSSAFHFPRTMVSDENLNMSFSGLKAAAARKIEKMTKEEIEAQRADLCASFQEAVVESLVNKLKQAQARTGLKRVVLSGGVSANSRLREATQAWADKDGLTLVIPPLRYCTDNAAMVGYAGILRLNRGEKHDQSLAPAASSWPGDFQEPSR